MDALSDRIPKFDKSERRKRRAHDLIPGTSHAYAKGNDRHRYSTLVDWQRALGSPCAQSRSNLRDLMNSLTSWTIEPAQELIVEGRESMHERAVGARARAGSFAVVHMARVRSNAISLVQFAGAEVTVHLYDLADGSNVAEADVSPGGTHIFGPLGQNRTDFGD